MKNISAESVIKLLIDAYKEALEDDGDFVATQLEKEFEGVVKKVKYDTTNDRISFEVADEESYELLPKRFKVNVRLEELNDSQIDYDDPTEKQDKIDRECDMDPYF